MIQLLLHLFGDFIVQNDHVALNKKKNTLKGWLYCTFHCVTYSLPFLLVTNWIGVLLIGITHFIIDKTNIVSYVLAFKNNVWRTNNDGKRILDASNFGFNHDRPFAISIWLNIFFDNTIHLILNFLIIHYFTK